MRFRITPMAAGDLIDYWNTVLDDEGWVEDNIDCIDAVREAYRWLLDGYARSANVGFEVTISDEAAREVLNEAEHRLELAKTHRDELHLTREATQRAQSTVLVREYSRLVNDLKAKMKK